MEYTNFGMYAIKVLLSNSSKSTLDEKNLETISNLKFIGTIQPGERIDSKTLQVEHPGIFTSIKRFLTGESRTALYEFVTITIHRIFEIINAKCNSESISDKYMCKNMINDLINSIIGLKNIQGGLIASLDKCSEILARFYTITRFQKAQINNF